MPAFQLAPDQVGDIATFLHAAIFLSANRRLYQVLDILTGDPKAGEAYFAGAGKCATCHSPTGDLKGIGAKYDAVTLQGRILMPRGGRGAGPPQPAYLDKNAIKASITLPSRQTISGVLVRLTDFDVTPRPQTGQVRSLVPTATCRRSSSPDPLQAPRSITRLDRRRHAQHDGLPGRSQMTSTRVLGWTFCALAALAPLVTTSLVAQQGAALDPAALLKAPTDSWPTYHGDYSGRRYSPLTQINADNVRNLQLAWVYRLNTSQALAQIGGEGPDVPPAAASGFGPPTIKATPLWSTARVLRRRITRPGGAHRPRNLAHF
jgi:hypothetical protein